MDVSQKELARLESMVRRAKADPSIELEWKFKGSLTQDRFTIVLSTLRNMGWAISTSESLDISIQNKRYHLVDKARILDYCKTDIIGGVGPRDSMDIKTPVEDGTLELSSNVRITLRKETLIENANEIKALTTLIESGQKKHFRYKKRYELSHANSAYRVDATVVKSSPNTAARFALSGTLAAKERFEVELELVDKSRTPHSVALEGVELMTVVLGSVVSTVEDPAVSTKKLAVLMSYLKLTGQSSMTHTFVMKQPARYFIGPKNVALDVDTVKSLETGYCVTEKTDGERALLFVDADGACYRIDNRLTVEETGLQYDGARCIFDGEFVKGAKDVFYIFDVYYINNKPVFANPLLGTGGRMSYVRLSDFSKNGALVIQVKNFFVADASHTIYEQAREILDKESVGGMDVAIDGLIFTPIAAPDSLKSLGERTYKWKPPEDNTIDFLVKFDSRDTVLVGTPPKPHVKVRLQAGSKKSRDLDVVAILTRKPLDDNYVAVDFEECYMPVEDDGTILTHEARQERIESGMIVEVGMHLDREPALAWFPKRIRHDKNQMLLLQNGVISGTANDFQVALKTLHTIENPVTRSMITTGHAPGFDATIVETEGVYYTNGLTRTQRENSPMIALRKFHNYIKDALIKGQGLSLGRHGSRRLFDIGVGRGGDLQKWIYAKYEAVLGIDVVADNILAVKDSAYVRYQEQLSKRTSLKALFLIMDAGKPWSDEYIARLPRLQNRYLAKVAFGSGIAAAAVEEKLLREQWYNVVERGFDVVSCQFAVHYFFKTRFTLEAFCANVSRVIKKGGYFIGTCMDGKAVHELLNADNIAKGVGEDGQLLWQIQKHYTQFNDMDPEENIGLQITNFIDTIGAHFVEYLVDMRVLENTLAKYNIRPVAMEGEFANLYDDYCAKTNTNMLMSPTIKAYSFLNRRFAFRAM